MWTETPPAEEEGRRKVQTQGGDKRRIGTKRR